MRNFHSITMGQIHDQLVFLSGQYRLVEVGLPEVEVEAQGLVRQKAGKKNGVKYEKIGAPGLIPYLTRTTLNRREVDLGFAKPGRTEREWRLFNPQKAQAFMIAVLERYDKPLNAGLEEAMNDPKVREYLNNARREALRQETLRRQALEANQQIT